MSHFADLPRLASRAFLLPTLTAVLPLLACRSSADRAAASFTAADSTRVRAEVEAVTWAFHAADTARSAEAVISLLWPEYTMLVDGVHMTYSDAAAGSREFMTTLALFHTEWTELRVLPLAPNVAISSFRFRDSILTHSGQLIRNEGTTTFVWQRRDTEWRVLYADADHRLR